MSTLAIALLSILAFIVLIGIIRVIFNPYTNFLNFLLEIMLLDFLGDIFGWIFETIGDLLGND